jgi:hypothetical protein
MATNRRKYVAPGDEDAVPEQPLVTPTPTKKPKQLDLKSEDDPKEGWLDRIIDTVVSIDAEAENERLKLELRLSNTGSTATMSEIFDALESVQDNADASSRLYMHISMTVAAAEVDMRIIEAALRTRAVDELKAEKDDAKREGSATKQITEKDVSAYIDTHFTDEIRDLEVKREANKRVVDHFQNRARLWRDRSRTLEALATGKQKRATYDD